MKVKYIGDQEAGVEVRPWGNPDAGRVVVLPGQGIETSREHAEALLLSEGNWAKIGPKEKVELVHPVSLEEVLAEQESPAEELEAAE